MSFINNFLTICPTRLRFFVLLDHSIVYIVPKREISACVSLYYIPVFLKACGQSYGFALVELLKKKLFKKTLFFFFRLKTFAGG